MGWYTEKSVSVARTRRRAEGLKKLGLLDDPDHKHLAVELEKDLPDQSGEELLPNYSYEKTILPTEKKYQEVLRKDTSFPKYFHTKLVYKPDKKDWDFEVVNQHDPANHGELVGKR